MASTTYQNGIRNVTGETTDENEPTGPTRDLLDGVVDDPGEETGSADADGQTVVSEEPATAMDAAQQAVPDEAGEPERAVRAADEADAVGDGTGDGKADRVRGLLRRARTGLRAVRLPASRRGKIVAALALVLALGLTGGSLTWWLTWRLPDGVAYRAAGQDVTVEDLDHQMDTLTALYGMQKPEDPAALDTFRRDFAKASAVGGVIDRAAAAQGIVIADKAAQDFLGRYVDQYFGAGDGARQRFVTALGTVGTSEPAVLAEIRRQMAASRLFEAVTKDVPAATDAEVDAAFTERKEALATPETRTLANIVVADEATAQQVLAEIQGGRPFADVARTRSADASSRDAGGAIGTLAAAQLEKPYADAAFGAGQGAVFGPVRTQSGWNVGVVTAIQASTPADPARLHEPLRQQLLLERQGQRWRDFLGGELAAADVRYADDYQPADPAALPSTPTGITPGAPR
ncbi:peptidylprolyl isomerase [Pseudonocardia sp. RS11V-5]|uniref:peptidylprolyl isomerase n=1 Tax=Pseudonocardia terrae TaxID=2905831 RepID=UPI001E35543B|nr:peptidylprolyl isomerase [Pseudonocardia terrae]MCE3554472.1 peptidylprolyl isomerase [Pseudonocardia terrae]